MGLSLIVLLHLACGSPSSDHASQTAEVSLASPDGTEVTGVYTGIWPCDDCAGIETRLLLNSNSTYLLSSIYRGKSATPVVARGTYLLHPPGTLELTDLHEGPTRYLVEPHALIPLDAGGNAITGSDGKQLRLGKTLDAEIGGIRWNLESLMDKYLGLNPAYLMFHPESGRFSGFGWCNSYTGNFTTDDQHRLVIQALTVGENPCEDSIPEMQLMNMLRVVNGIDIEQNMLHLYRNRNSPMATFRKAQLRGVPNQ